MPVIPAQLVHAQPSLSREELQSRLLSGQTLLSDTPDHLLQVVAAVAAAVVAELN